jgi:hypothetical protein
MGRQDRSNSNGKRNVTMHADYREKGKSDGRLLHEWQLQRGPVDLFWQAAGGAARVRTKANKVPGANLPREACGCS